MEEILLKLGFVKQEKAMWIGYHDYLLDELNHDYPHFLRVTISLPRGVTENTVNFEHRCAKIILHRNFDRTRISTYLAEGDSKLVYEGLLNSREDLLFILYNTGVFNISKIV